MNHEQLVDNVLRAVDARDVTAFAGHLAPDVVFRFGNAAPVQGVEAVHAAVEQFLAGLQAIAHEVAGAWQSGDVIAAHGRVTYTRLDGSALSVPFALVWHLADGRIREYLIFADLSAL